MMETYTNIYIHILLFLVLYFEISGSMNRGVCHLSMDSQQPMGDTDPAMGNTVEQAVETQLDPAEQLRQSQRALEKEKSKVLVLSEEKETLQIDWDKLSSQYELYRKTVTTEEEEQWKKTKLQDEAKNREINRLQASLRELTIGQYNDWSMEQAEEYFSREEGNMGDEEVHFKNTYEGRGTGRGHPRGGHGRDDPNNDNREHQLGHTEDSKESIIQFKIGLPEGLQLVLSPTMDQLVQKAQKWMDIKGMANKNDSQVTFGDTTNTLGLNAEVLKGGDNRNNRDSRSGSFRDSSLKRARSREGTPFRIDGSKMICGYRDKPSHSYVNDQKLHVDMMEKIKGQNFPKGET